MASMGNENTPVNWRPIGDKPLPEPKLIKIPEAMMSDILLNIGWSIGLTSSGS